MKLRAPAYPLITVDPYFSIWSMHNELNGDDVKLWTGRRTLLLGRATIDGVVYVFMGPAHAMGQPAMRQTAVDFSTFTTAYTFEAAGVSLTAAFTTPVLPDDLELLSRPVSYLHVGVHALDGREHTVEIEVKASEEFCLERNDHNALTTQEAAIAEGVAAMRIGGIEQPILGKSGDGIGIDWGYFYLAVQGGTVTRGEEANRVCLCARTTLSTNAQSESLFTFAYDDIYSVVYFGDRLRAYWKRDGQTIEQAIAAAYAEYDALLARCAAFHAQLVEDATAAGGEKYAELLVLALRQVMAAHKLVVDADGQLLYISKECYSNGCAATVDVSYPSIPLFLLYNPELVKGMMRPIFRYAASELWPYEFAPHDAGVYPILNGQVYSRGTDIGGQMPVEECGNMLLMAIATAAAEKKADFAREHRALLDQWANYLLGHGVDPENQLCTDDFAGHLAHNCNLSLKAIMALAGYARLCTMWGEPEAAAKYDRAARDMTQAWIQNAANGDGSYRLAFDQPDTFSMKYNVIWDKVLGLGLFPQEVLASEVASYAAHCNPYGLPLDNRADYTKSDWLIWTATLADSKEQFESLVAPLWLAYHLSPSRVPMTDWYSTVTSLQIGFQHRTVQGGLFMKLLDEKGVCRF